MSRYFVTDAPVAVYEFDPQVVQSDQPPNVIYIRAKMDVETDAKVKNALVGVTKAHDVEYRPGDNSMSLLIHNILRWEGPDLGNIPCTPESIRRMDPTEPHLALVLEEIARRNKRPEGPSPKSAGASTSASAGASDSRPAPPAAGQSLSAQLATGTPRSPLLSAINGRPSRLDD